ncbi:MULTISPECIES: ADP-ribosylation factor GTPase-activating family protein [Amycolatopsis]|uniref:NifU family protein n=2 Tax=Amycolatopsis methanolica group TaxID=2893674 RepID=A0A076N6Z4_AMYME|nr:MULTISPECIES: hypothetical protein [Amycolatopsis methanolica group]AIJ25767.1 hypothetical protein AMETH_5675 [Amycolatopsis methanolica 239]ROS42307.1 hypothetical protein EDD35_4693 [Amycolatopsis thermoflava]
MIDQTGLAAMRTTLAADGYALDVAEEGGRVAVRISVADPAACADCLAPEPIMRGILHQSLGVPEQVIDLTYPGDDDDR